MELKLYVQSRGVSKDYCWLDKNQTRISDLPNNLKRMLEMVDGDYFSLVIYRANGQLSLLVTALKSQNRIDNRTRKICNSVLWVGKDSDEATLRKLAIQALNGELEAKVDEAVASENNDQGFTVNFDLLKPEKLGLQDVESQPADDHKDYKIGNLSAFKDELIDDLKKYALPKDDGMLVVVSSTVSKSSLERERVWRGLSDAISDDDWIDISSADSKKSSKENKGDDFRYSKNSEKNSSNAIKNRHTDTGNKNKDNYRESGKKQGVTIIEKVLLVVLLGLLIVIFILKWQLDEATKNQKDNETLREENKEFINKNETLKKQLEKEVDELEKFIQLTEQFNKEGRQLLEETNNFLKDYDKVINGIQK